MEDIVKIISEISPAYKKKGPASEHFLVYDSSSETLEPLYFWILDYISNMYGGNVEKIVDNFASSPGSGHFSELGTKMSQMQQEATRVLGTVNNILKGILNLIYDLKEFKVRLSHYDSAESKDKATKEAGILALKQIWMDKVDMQRGAGSLNALSSGNLQFVTLRDAFMVAKSVEDVDEYELNDRVKRVLKPRLLEFFEWKKRSEQELRKRFEIEKIYLKSQVDALKLNARWARPYLRAAEQLRANEGLLANPGLVTAFNTVILELMIMAKQKVNVDQLVVDKDVPPEFGKLKRKMRDYYAVVLIDFNFRGIPSKQGQHYVFGGKADVRFRAYALNEDEIIALKDKMAGEDMKNALMLVEGMTEDSLKQINADIEEFLGDADKKEKEKKEEDDINPFSALFGVIKPAKKEVKKEKEEDKLKKLKQYMKEHNGKLRPDTYAESYIRSIAQANAMNASFIVYDKYKKAHHMFYFPYGGDDASPVLPKSGAEKFFSV